MIKTITVAAYNRPQHLVRLLRSLRRQIHSLADYKLYIRIDGGGARFEEVKQVALAARFMDIEVFWAEQNEGVNLNTYALMERVFEKEWTDWNVYLEDDSFLSPDAFNLIEWYIEHEEEIRAVEGVEDIGAYCLLNLRGRGDPEKVFLMDAFMGWCFLLDSYQWQTYAKPAWCNSKELWGHEGMWDNSMAKYIRQCGRTIMGVFPEVSRVTNTGRVGRHCTPQRYDELMKGHIYNQNHRAYAYKLVGVSKPKYGQVTPFLKGRGDNASDHNIGGGGGQTRVDGGAAQGDGPGGGHSCGIEGDSAGGEVQPEAGCAHPSQKCPGNCA